jgi:prolyl-tRNA synthetase
MHGDNKGLILPPTVSPIQTIIVPVYYSKNEEKRVLKEASFIKQNLEKNKIRAKIDDRKEFTPGWKYNYWELKGVPLRIEIGPKDIKKKQVVLVRRDKKEKITVKYKVLEKTVKKLLDDIQKNLIRKADKFLKDNIRQASEFKELKKILKEKGGLIRTNWCGKKECADYIKAETEGGTIKGTLFGKSEKIFGKCVYCGKEANQVVYIAKEY